LEPPDTKPSHAAVIMARREALRQSWDGLCIKERFLLEIGCGHGHFLTAYAAAHPNESCIGIDVIEERIERAIRKRDRAGLSNLHFLRADVWDFFASIDVSNCISDIYILFPDPWPKRRHHKNRVVEPAFLKAAAERAGKGAKLYFRTDFAPYFAEAKGLLDSSGCWNISPSAGWPFEVSSVFQERASSFQSLVAERI
jgi:tRNA (guanine-N7-)-methyltransferase